MSTISIASPALIFSWAYGEKSRKNEMIKIAKARPEDVEKLTETQIRAFIDDNKNKPPKLQSRRPSWLQLIEVEFALDSAYTLLQNII